MPPYTSDIATKPKRRARSSSRKGTRTSPRAAAARKAGSSSSSSSSSTATDDADAWIYRLDVGAFKKDMDALKAELTKTQGPADVAQYVVYCLCVLFVCLCVSVSACVFYSSPSLTPASPHLADIPPCVWPQKCSP